MLALVEAVDSRVPTVRSAPPRTTLPIERALEWAYRMELPKFGERDGKISAMFRNSDLGAKPDDWSHEPGFPSSLGRPHPDAVSIDFVVSRLSEQTVDWQKSCASFMPDLALWLNPGDHARLSRMSFQTSALVMTHARMGTRPAWDLGPTKVMRVLSKNGKDPLLQFIDHEGRLVEGRTSARHYGQGARCVTRLQPSALKIAEARAEYFVWRAALADVANTLRSWKLQEHIITAPVAAAEPWIADTENRSRVLRSVRS